MPSRCMVPGGCHYYRKKREEGSVSYHRLPTDVARCKEWLRAIRNPKYDEDTPRSVLGNLRVCSLHFTAGDYSRDMQSEMMGGINKKSLKTSAVPALFGSDIGPGEAEPRERRGRTQTEEEPAAVRVSSCGTETRPVAASAHSPGELDPQVNKMEYKLIMAVSGFPSLYDTNSLTYRDLNMRSDAWRQVAEIVGVPESECRRKWKMLRDQHRRERQREKERRESGVGLFNYRPWRYSAILSFLNPFIDARAAGTNGWALDPQPSLLQVSEMVGCSTTTETRSDDDDNYGIAVADATTTTSSSSSSSEFVQRKRPSSANRDTARLKEAKLEVTSETAATDDSVQIQQVQHVNMRELFEMMMQSVTSLATSLASSHSSSQPSDQLMPPAQSSPAGLQPDLQHLQTHRGLLPSCTTSCTTSRLNHLKTEEQEAVVTELLDQTDGEEECRAASPRPTRPRRRSTDGLLEEYLRRMEAREAQRDRDVDQRDDVTLFLLSLAPAMRRLPAEKQSWVRTKMQQFLHEAEFGATSFQ